LICLIPSGQKLEGILLPKKLKMITLDLTNLANSQIKYKISEFPDGQQNIVLEDTYPFWGGFNYANRNLSESAGVHVEIKSRLNNWKHLELIACAVASLKEFDITNIHLYAPYIMGARSDRKFEYGGNNYLKDVICPAINSLGFKTVTCIDPHSDCLEMGIKGFRKQSNLDVVDFAIKSIYNTFYVKGEDAKVYNNFILISPDAGASKKIYKTAEKIEFEGDIITCSKDRGADGKLTKCVVDISTHQKHSGKDYIIIDDICDGGATFINIANAIIDKHVVKPKIYLIVTHGIFSKGFQELEKYFDGIYCTNSIGILDNNCNLLDTKTDMPVNTLDVFGN